MPERFEDLTPEHRAKVDNIRARRATPEARAEEERVRKLVEEEFPPIRASPELIQALARLKVERERQGLSLADVAAESKIDRAMVSRLENGKVPNPTFETLRRYARAIGMDLALTPVGRPRRKVSRKRHGAMTPRPGGKRTTPA